jgi:hypothetical protein
LDYKSIVQGKGKTTISTTAKFVTSDPATTQNYTKRATIHVHVTDLIENSILLNYRIKREPHEGRLFPPGWLFY